MIFLKVFILSLMQSSSDEWQLHTLPKDMRVIAYLESSYGTNINHKPDFRGEVWSAYGPLGLKFVTAYEAYAKSTTLKARFPDLNREEFVKSVKQSATLYNLSAIEHWNRIRSSFAQLDRAVYSWRYGITAARNATAETVANDSYVVAYKKTASVID